MTGRGYGQGKHLDIEALWCLEAIAKGRFRLMKVDSENNPADTGTKALSADSIVHVLRLLGNGRSVSIAGSPWSRLKTTQCRGRGYPGVIPKSSHSAMDASAR